EVKLFLVGTGLVRPVSVGLRELQGTDAPGPQDSRTPWRTFLYGQPPARLTLHGQTASPDRSAEAVVDQSSLTTAVHPDGRLLQQFRFRLGQWRDGTPLLLRLPLSARPLAATVDGRWIRPLPINSSSGGS